jgi:hypothetical protein
MGREAGGTFSLFHVALAIAVIVMTAVAFLFAGEDAARADIRNYLKGPNLFYPSGSDRPGPVNLTIQTAGWNATRIAGNVGIGNGSVRTFDRTSTFDVEYPVNAFMCGDVSTQPWIPGLKTEVPQAEAAAEENATGEVTGEGAFDRSGRFATNASSATNATNITAPVNTEQVKAAGEDLTFAAYHPINYLSPVKDVLYEHPLATSGTTYCELLGFVPPAGPPVNVGMKCTGYGY